MKFAITISGMNAAELFGVQQALDGLTQETGFSNAAEGVAIMAEAETLQHPAPLAMPLGDNAPAAAPVAAPPAAPVMAMPLGDNAPAATIAQPADDLDVDGVAWNAELHSTPAKKTTKGKWRVKRKSKEDAAAPAVTTAVQMPVEQSAPAAPVVAPAAPVVAQPAPVAQAAPATPAPAGGAMDFVTFMGHVRGKMTEMGPDGATPVIPVTALKALTDEIGTLFGAPIGNIVEIQNDPQKIAYAIQILQRDGRW